MAENILQSDDSSKVTGQFWDNFLTAFALKKSRDGLEIEIVGCAELAPVVGAIECVRGVVYLRRKAIPVIDLQVKFGLDATKISGSSCILLTEHKRNGKKYNVGIIVGDISDVFAIASQNMEGPSDYDVSGLEAGDRFEFAKALTNIDHIIHDIDFDRLEKML